MSRLVSLAWIAAVVLAAGCQPAASSATAAPAKTDWDQEALKLAASGLTRLIEDVAVRRDDATPPANDLLRNDVFEGVLRRLAEWVRSGNPRLGWEPDPAELHLDQIVARLNQWLKLSSASGPWRRDPLLDTLPAALRESLPQLSEAALAQREFNRHVDGPILQEAVWLRDISRWARGHQTSPAAEVAALFDWTVRNIALEDAPTTANSPPTAPPTLRRAPWKTLLFARGNAWERAHVFSLLARQQGHPVVILAHPDSRDATRWVPWVAAALVDEAQADKPGGRLLLFDPWLGLPLLGPDGRQVATLDQVLTDDGLLRQLDLDAAHPYPVRREQLSKLAAFIPASPAQLSSRMRLLESQLAGDQKLALSIDAAGLAERLRKVAGISEVRLWPAPFEAFQAQAALDQPAREAARRELMPFLAKPQLWHARLLHFHGGDDFWKQAGRRYLGARPADSRIAAAQLSPESTASYVTAKQLSTWQLGNVCYERGQLETAAAWLETREPAGGRVNPWFAAQRYALARVREAQGRRDEAVALLEAAASPQRHGDLLRARRLKGEPPKVQP